MRVSPPETKYLNTKDKNYTKEEKNLFLRISVVRLVPFVFNYFFKFQFLPASSRMRLAARPAEMSTVGTPVPGCVLAPTKYRLW